MPRIFPSVTSFRLRPQRVISFTSCSLGLGEDIDLGFDAHPNVYAHVMAGRVQSNDFLGISDALGEVPAENFGTLRADFERNYLEIHFLLDEKGFVEFWRDVISLFPNNLEVEIGFSSTELIDSYKNAKVGLIDNEFSISLYPKGTRE